MKRPRLATLLTLGFTALVWLTTVALALVLRLGIEANFQTYLDSAQAAAHGRIMGALAGLREANGTWDRDLVAALGRQALDQGLVLAIRDGAGAVVWDARTEDPERVDQEFRTLESRLKARAPWETGRWQAWEHPLAESSGSGGTMVVDVFEPRRLGASDLAFLQGLDALVAALALGGLVLAVLLGTLTARAVVRPLMRVQDNLHRLAAGDYGEPAPARSAFSEGRDLEVTLGLLAGRLARLQALRDTAGADTAHELRTPLANLGAQLEALEDGVFEPSPERFAALGAETRRLLGLVEAWEDLERARSPRQPGKGTEAPGDVVQAAVAAFQARVQARGQSLTCSVLEPVGPVPLGPSELGRLVVNLVENAHRYAPDGGRIAVTLGSSGPRTVLTVEDDGPGILPEHRDAVFDRFYRADPSRSRESGGLGLGLSLVRALAEGTGGSASAETSPWGGCRIRVILGPP